MGLNDKGSWDACTILATGSIPVSSTMINIKRISLKGGLEYDILTGCRKDYYYTKKPRICKYVKRKYNKRFRKAVKDELKRRTYYECE